MPGQEATATKTPEDTLKELQELLKNPIVSELHKIRKPKGYAKRSNTSYYKLKFALEYKALVDKLLATGETQRVRYSDFPEYSKTTIYLRVTQGKNYLLENLDPDNYYMVAHEHITIHREPRKGVEIQIHQAKRALRSVSVQHMEEYIEWKHQLQDFLENAPEGAEFTKKGLCLTHEEIALLKSTLEPLDNIGSNITQTTVTLRKLPSEMLKDEEGLLP